MKDIISAARNRVNPTAPMVKRKRRTAEAAIHLVKEQAESYPQVKDVEFGGSYAKDTWLRDKSNGQGADVDIFVRFKKSTHGKEFEKILLKIGFEAMRGFGPYTRHAQHPFVEAVVNHTKVNIVPCYDVSRGRWQSAADRSPYHTKFVQENFTEEMKCEVRLLKAFLGAAGIYGAEIGTQGFSGYVCEVLIYHFKRFDEVVKNMARLEENRTVGRPRKKFDTPLILIDPIDGKRNLAAAISEENIGRLVLRCRAFQDKPGPGFFRPKRPARVWNGMGNVLTVRFGYSSRSPETIQGQVRRFAASVTSKLDAGGFNVLRSGAHAADGRAHLFFLLEAVKIPSVRVREGPEFYRYGSTGQFIKKNIKKSKLMWVGPGGRITSLEAREFTDAAPFLKDMLGNGRICIPKGLVADLGNGFRVFPGTGRASKSVKEVIKGLVSTDDAFVCTG